MYLLHREDMPPPASRCSPRLASRPMSPSNRESRAQASAQLTAHLASARSGDLLLGSAMPTHLTSPHQAKSQVTRATRTRCVMGHSYI
jgi:hypothetical protein